MHIDLMLLYLYYLWIIISMKKKNWENLLSISLLSSIRGHPGQAKYRIVWATLDAFSLAYAIRIVAKCIPTSASWPFLGKLPQQLNCRENWIYIYKIHQFSQHYHPSSIDL